MSARRRERFDPVRLALVNQLLAAAAEEMGAALGRSASSANIKERRDYSCAVFDHEGRMIAQAAHIPVHLGSMPMSVRAALARGPLGPGDGVLVNDPYEGGTHLPDITLVSPVYLKGERRPRFYVANRAHHADVGGMSPGSLPLSREMVQEGVRIPPVKIVKAGVVQDDLWRLICANVRTPKERQADLEAQIGANATGAARLQDLAHRSGADELTRGSAALLDYAERGVRAVLARIRPGRYACEDALDDDGHGGPPVPIRVAITIGRGGRGGARARLDFTGSSPQIEGPLNAVWSITLSAVLYAFRCLAGRDLPTNEGCLRPLEVTAPAGTIVNCRYPAAVSSGNVETSQRITDALLGALAKALPAEVPAASYGTMNNVLIGGTAQDGEPFAYYETIGGGHGGGPAGPGASGMQAHMTNTLNTPIEAFEHLFPMRVRRYALRRGSGGRGRHAGGEGIVREIEMLVPATVTVISDRRVLAPPGRAGGGDGAPGRNARVDAVSGRAEELPGKFQRRFAAGDRLIVESPGGGGWGKARATKRAKPARRARRRTR